MRSQIDSKSKFYNDSTVKKQEKTQSKYELISRVKKILDKDEVNPVLRQKLTGREVSTYFRRNPVRDGQIKKAVEVALDLQVR